MFKAILKDNDGNHVNFMVTFQFPHKRRHIQNQTLVVCKIFKEVVKDGEKVWQQVCKGKAVRHSIERIYKQDCPHCKKEFDINVLSRFDKEVGRKFAFKNTVKNITDKESRTLLWEGYWNKYAK